MQEFEREMIEAWHSAYKFEEIVHYIKMLKEPTYEHLGKLASALNNLRRYYEALDVLESIKDAGENDLRWHYRMGYSLMCVEQYEQAEHHLLKCVEIDNDDGDSWFMLAELYRHFLPNQEKLEKVEQELLTKKVYATELIYDDFVTGQTFNKNHRVLDKLQTENEQTKTQLVACYEQFTDALEDIVQSNTQVPRLVIGLAQAIRTFAESDSYFQEQLKSDRMTQYLSAELLYILNWFGVSEETLTDALNLFLYTLTKEDSNIVSPEHLYELVTYSHQSEHQKIVDFYRGLSAYDQGYYEYAQWAIQAHIHLRDYEDALALLEFFSKEGETDSQWYYWYALCCTNIQEYEDARDLLFTCLKMEITFLEAWELLEYVLLNGFSNISGATWVKEKKESIVKTMENTQDDDVLAGLVNMSELKQKIYPNDFSIDNSDFFA